MKRQIWLLARVVDGAPVRYRAYKSRDRAMAIFLRFQCLYGPGHLEVTAVPMVTAGGTKSQRRVVRRRDRELDKELNCWTANQD